MQYTPGFLVLQALFFRVFGYVPHLWIFIGSLGSITYALTLSAYFWRRAPLITPLVPASLLACLFPVLWPRADLYAVLLLGIGFVVLLEKRAASIAVLLFGLSLFFKQTSLPAIILAAFLGCYDGRSDWRAIRRSISIVGSSVAVFAVLLALYAAATQDSLRDMIAIFSIGRDHPIPATNITYYSMISAALTALPTIALLKSSGGYKFRVPVIALHVFSLPYIIFAAKAGGHWHHFLFPSLAWLWLLGRTSESLAIRDRALALTTIGSLLALLIAGYFQGFGGPVPATAEDQLAGQELATFVANIPPQQALFLDSESGLGLTVGATYRGLSTRYDRGAFEEHMAAGDHVPADLIVQIQSGTIPLIIRRLGRELMFTAYGNSYAPMNQTIKTGYAPCQGYILQFWEVLCSKNDQNIRY
ncbi:hypothetical protein NS365_04485 [Aureimonas ureilytica]|uniref:Uncharacterized protein n=2 Tax=Aureimonas ureilytica TaxID=401562 RepID=A0A175RWR3_9HYPH|nr:hypothetical protein NS365_04485 [Aureimonas ureilytica]